MRTHTGEIAIMCEVCSKVFSYNISLKIHMKTHNGEVIFHSAVCNKAFADKVNLKIHTRTHIKTFIKSTVNLFLCAW